MNKTGNTNIWERLRRRFVQGKLSRADAEDRPRSRSVAITLCIVISCILWITFSMKETYTADITMPTFIENLPDDQAFTSLPPSEVTLKVEGEGFQVARLQYNKVAIPINASNGQVNFEAAIPRSQLPRSVNVLSINPSSMELRTEPRITRKIPVRLVANINMPATHDLLQPIQVDPDSVVVSGARSIVNRLERWETEPVIYDDLRDSLITYIPLKDTLGGLLLRIPEQVKVTALAGEFVEGIRELEVKVRRIPSAENVVTLEPPIVEVRYRTPIAQYAEAQRAVDFFAEISYDEIISDTTGRLRPRVYWPQDLDVRDVEVIPSTVGYYQQVGE